MDVQIHIFLTAALVGAEWSASRPNRFIPGKINSGTLQDRRVNGPQNSSGVGEDKILPILGLELRPHGRINYAEFLTCKALYEQSA
jgi:hypothetical protein